MNSTLKTLGSCIMVSSAALLFHALASRPMDDGASILCGQPCTSSAGCAIVCAKGSLCITAGGFPTPTETEGTGFLGGGGHCAPPGLGGGQ
jgi:hypothetical protein